MLHTTHSVYIAMHAMSLPLSLSRGKDRKSRLLCYRFLHFVWDGDIVRGIAHPFFKGKLDSGVQKTDFAVLRPSQYAVNFSS